MVALTSCRQSEKMNGKLNGDSHTGQEEETDDEEEEEEMEPVSATLVGLSRICLAVHLKMNWFYTLA